MNEENNKELNYDFDFENQVTKKEENLEETEVLQEDDEVLEEIDENTVEHITDVNDVKATTSDLKNEKIIEKTEILQEDTEVLKESEANEEQKVGKKIKILGKEFLIEDLILIGIGLLLVISIFLMPKIVDIFS